MLAERYDLTSRVALVTGGTRGLGRATARALAEAGADVIVSRSLKAILDDAAAAGFASVGLDSVTAAGAADIAGTLRPRGLACTDVGSWCWGRTPPPTRSCSPRWRASGATTCLVAWPAGVDRYSALEASADILSANCVRLALKFFPYGALPTLESALASCEAVGWDRCGVPLDPWHFFRSGEPWDLLRSLDPEQIAIVHANDVPAMVRDDLSYESRHRRLPMGSGTFAIAEFVSAVNSLGYRGVISAEVLSTTFREQEPVEGARTLMDAFRTHWPVT